MGINVLMSAQSDVRYNSLEVKAAACQCFQEKVKYIFKGRIKKLVKQWQKCVGGGEDYMEKLLCTVVNKG